MSAAHSIPLSDELYREISDRADNFGLSAQGWVSSVLAEHLRLERLSEEFFKQSAAGANGRPLGELLDQAADNPPDPGDELPD